MLKLSRILLVAAFSAFVLDAAIAAGKPMKSARAESAKKVAVKRTNLIAEMNGPYHVAAASHWQLRPVITQWPMPNTVWW